jgi:hypothetical protein
MSVQHKNLKDGRLSLLTKYIIPGEEVSTAALCLEGPGFKSEKWIARTDVLSVFLIPFFPQSDSIQCTGGASLSKLHDHTQDTTLLVGLLLTSDQPDTKNFT